MASARSQYVRQQNGSPETDEWEVWPCGWRRELGKH